MKETMRPGGNPAGCDGSSVTIIDWREMQKGGDPLLQSWVAHCPRKRPASKGERTSEHASLRGQAPLEWHTSSEIRKNEVISALTKS